MLVWWLVISVVPIVGAASPPTLVDLSGEWINIANPRISQHVNTSSIDLPIISNFHGSVGSNPNGDYDTNPHQRGISHKHVTPVDLFSMNSLEIPPFAGCGNSVDHNTPNGCGRMLLDGVQVVAEMTKYAAFEVARSTRGVASLGLAVSSRMRMLFENQGVLWQLNFTNPSSTTTLKQDLTFELAAMVREYSHIAWVQSLPYNPHNFTYTPVANISASTLTGVMSVGNGGLVTGRGQSRPATSLYAFVGGDGGAQPDAIMVNSSSNIPIATFTGFTVPARATR